jgi:uncharacterized membrane protein YbhN (UPF0104 family)
VTDRPSAGARLTRILEAIRRRPSPRVQRVLLVVSVVIFVAAAVAGIDRFPATNQVRWGLVVAAGGLGMPLNVALNAAEFQVIGRMLGQRVGFGTGVRVTIVGSAANLLPLPGSTLVRIQALAAGGGRYRRVVSATVVVGVLAVGASLLLAGVAQAPTAPPLLVAGVLAAGVAALGLGLAVLRVSGADRLEMRWGAAAIALEFLYASISALRLWLILVGLGMDVGLPSAFALTAVGTLATAVGFFPAGIGIRETLMGAVSPLVGVPMAVGLTGAVAERTFWFIVLAVAALVLLAREGSTAFTGSGSDDPGPAS